MNPDGTGRHSKGFLEAHVWIIAFAMVMSVLAAVAVFSLRPSKYVSSASVTISPEVINGVPMEPQMGTEQATASSGNVLRRAAALLHEPPEVMQQGLSVSVPVDTTVVDIAFKAATPTAAFNGADAVTRAYVDYRNSGGGARVAEVITPATVPNGPSAVNYTLVVVVAAAGGLLIGVAAAVVWDLAFSKIRADTSGGGRVDAASTPWPYGPRRKGNGGEREARLPPRDEPGARPPDAGVKD